MIRGLHGLFYSSDADATRAFMRDQLQLPHVDVGGGWLIFDLPESDIGVHPVDESGQPPPNTHDVSFFCDDIEGTVADLRSRGVELDEPQDHGYGFVTHFAMPGGVRVQLYQPKYEKRAKPAAPKAAKAAKAPKAKAKKKTKAKPKPKAKAKKKKR
jgi:catechol 2,3-dioxygenase-like lactoylglutathione lyase family enzyme